MNLPTAEMSVVKDCNGFIWQVQDAYWRSTRKYSQNHNFYVIEATYAYGPAEFEKQFGPLTVLSDGPL